MPLLSFIWVLVIGFILGLSSLYISLKLGVVLGVSLLTVIFIKGLESTGAIKAQGGMFTPQDYGYFLAFTTGLSFSTLTLISTVLSALVLNGALPSNKWLVVIWIMSLNILGTFLAWHLREHTNKSRFPSATAAADLITNSNKGWGRRWFWGPFSAASTWIFLRKVTGILGANGYAPLYYGMGGLLGVGTATSFFLGGLFFFAGPVEWLPTEFRPAWFVVAGILIYTLFDFCQDSTFWKRSWSELRLTPLFIAVLGVGILTGFLFQWLFASTFLALFIAVLLMFPSAFVASKVTGETDVTPLGALGKLSLLLTSFLPGNFQHMALVGQVVAPSAACADFSSDLKCGSLLNCKPKKQLSYQLVGACLGPILFVPIFYALANRIGQGVFPVPSAAIWNQFSLMLGEQWDTLSVGMQWSTLAGGLLGGAIFLMRRLWGPYVPSAVPFFIAYYLDLSSTFAIFCGGVLALGVSRVTSEQRGHLIWAGLLAGESILGLALLLF